MSDKPLVQQALAEDLASLVQDIPANNVIPFLEAFWEIHCAEWHGLDRIRYLFANLDRRRETDNLVLD